MSVEPLSRLDSNPALRKKLLPFCRLDYGSIWEDPVSGHRVGVLNAASEPDVIAIMKGEKAKLIINDPPYNIKVGSKKTDQLFNRNLKEYLDFSESWVANSDIILDTQSSLYIWLGSDQTKDFQPLPDFMILMRNFKNLKARSFITLRNQRGFGTQKNWMFIRQELLYYTKDNPEFSVVYTDIPKVLKGYYKTVGGKITENIERSRSNTIRPGNIWIDIQQVFYRMKENVPGAYAQKPLKAIDRIIKTSSRQGDLVVDFFAHSGTTLISSEILKRRCFTFDLDPVFAELTIRRLEHYRETGETGWQYKNPFVEIDP